MEIKLKESSRLAEQASADRGKGGREWGGHLRGGETSSLYGFEGQCAIPPQIGGQ